MASNSTTGTMPTISAHSFEALTTTPATVVIAVVLGFLFVYALTPRLDPREPPLVKPSIPFLGHILGMMRQQAQYHITLQRTTGQSIATLPMLTGKMYAVWDPHLIAAALRNKALSTNPHQKSVAPVLCQLSPHSTALLKTPTGDALINRLMTHGMQPGFRPASVQRMNATALPALARQLSAQCFSSSSFETIPNTWLWLRRLLTSATGPAIYGPAADPFTHTPHAEAMLWDFEKHLLNLSLGIPTRAGNRARTALFGALAPYYTARCDEDPDAADFIRARATVLRDAGVPEEDLPRMEVMLPFAALANTVPMLFWLVGYLFSRSEVVAALRVEVEEGLVARREEAKEGMTVTVRTGAVVEDKCPRLMSCYRETLRCTVCQVSTRTAMQDTVLVGKDGREYLLKEGSVVQMSIGASHALKEYWGDDVDEFNPDRFLNRKGEDGGGGDGPGSARALRAAFLPFGGGIHLCPGRNFAFAELMAVMATLLLGFEIEPLGDTWKLPPFARRSMVDAVTKPAKYGEGFGVRIRRRPGWENVRWNFEQ